MLKSLLLLFLALRAADLVNLAGGLWLVPLYVAPGDLGAVLPLTTFATFIAFPLYAIAMTTLREAARLRAAGRSPYALIRGVFAAVGVATVFVLAVAAALLPRFLGRFRVSDSLSGQLAVAAAFLGCVAPVYLDQLQAAKRFGAVSAVEISAAILRLVVMAGIMPFRAIAGYFAGSVVKPLVQIAGPLVALRSERGSGGGAQTAEDGYWTPGNRRRFFKTFVLLLPYLGLPILASLAENDAVRTMLPSVDSAGYYMATRISDLMNYITYPILFVMFPYVTDASTHGRSPVKMVAGSCGVVLGVALVACGIVKGYGAEILSLLPNGEDYVAYAGHLPMLLLFMAFGASQAIVTNAEVAAGRFSFLWWLVPMNVIYIEVLPRLVERPSLGGLIAIFTSFALLRFIVSLFHLRRRA